MEIRRLILEGKLLVYGSVLAGPGHRHIFSGGVLMITDNPLDRFLSARRTCAVSSLYWPNGSLQDIVVWRGHLLLIRLGVDFK